MTLGETIHRLRTERNLSQSDLAEALDVSRQSISKWETDGAVPELDKLVKLSGLFGVSLDELVLGDQAKQTPQPAAPAPAPADGVKPTGGRHTTVGVILLCFGALVWLLRTLLGGLLGGLMLACPFVLCGAVCLCSRKHTGLWCAWVLFFSVNSYLRYATGITWRLTLWTLQYEPSMNYLRLAFAWGELLCFVLLLVFTVLRLGRQPLESTGRRLGLLAAGWAVFAALHIPFAGLSQVWYLWGDWCKFALLSVLLTVSVRLIRGWKERKGKQIAPGT